MRKLTVTVPAAAASLSANGFSCKKLSREYWVSHTWEAENAPHAQSTAARTRHRHRYLNRPPPTAPKKDARACLRACEQS